ncbi:hypothetical protein W97_05486 [Coniosporium apollinis CBS 100218]|uniref:Wbp11/ELF5/Saf1 N-terminal domain-containing protein n=1 Tax=Coniosporium apollinis (strain CBS 100218) TaxID=1168221 RepID=R7YX56_CONA1|nr:uncharacterized protein W97_05486 [Coniosporium apollinis CBS 100218]EON66389.1 hypothetical protein W97_05486 [Coniosporium apollinis CBS 100218]
MAKDKDRTLNPAAAQRKAEKQKALKKGKQQVQAQRNERLAKKNPARLQREIEGLKELEQSGGLKPRDKQTLEGLEKELRAVQKAREALGDAAPTFSTRPPRREGEGEGEGFRGGRGGGGGGGRERAILGKRRRDGSPVGRAHRDDSSETDEDVRSIPMPRDTPPPLPVSARQRSRNPNEEPLGSGSGARVPHALPPKPVAQTVYASAPVVRDLRKEAARFMPAAVAQKMKAAKGEGRLLEAEELERLERAGYGDARRAGEEAEREKGGGMMDAEVEMGDANLAEEEAAFERELREVEAESGSVGVEGEGGGGGGGRRVQVEDVEDDGL